MKCPHCEKEIYDGEDFCPYCGKKLEVGQKKVGVPTRSAPTFKPLIAGFIEIFSALVISLFALMDIGLTSPDISYAWIWFLPATLVFVGGFLAIARKWFLWPFICAIVLCLVLIGIPAFILLLKSEGEFK